MYSLERTLSLHNVIRQILCMKNSTQMVHRELTFGKYMVLKVVNCLTWEMVLKEANRMNTQCNQIRQVLCKNSIETLCRELTFGKYIVN